MRFPGDQDKRGDGAFGKLDFQIGCSIGVSWKAGETYHIHSPVSPVSLSNAVNCSIPLALVIGMQQDGQEARWPHQQQDVKGMRLLLMDAMLIRQAAGNCPQVTSKVDIFTLH